MPCQPLSPFRACVRSLAGIAVLAGIGVAPLQGQPVTYTFSGSGTGSFDGVPFTNAAFQIALRGDISSPGLIEIPVTNSTWYFGDLGELVATVDVAGVVAGGTFSNPMSVVANRGLGNGPAAVLGDRAQNLALLVLSGPAFTSVTLRNPVGPISVAGNNIYLNPEAFAGSPVSGRVLEFTSVSTASFTVAGGGVASTVPEPSTGVLAVGGAAVLIVVSRRRVPPGA